MKELLILTIKIYRMVISPCKAPCCRFVPTCSEYALLAVERHGAWKGLLLTGKRLLKCHPFHAGGYDPV
jgi:uncharacterized protein